MITRRRLGGYGSAAPAEDVGQAMQMSDLMRNFMPNAPGLQKAQGQSASPFAPGQTGVMPGRRRLNPGPGTGIPPMTPPMTGASPKPGPYASDPMPAPTQQMLSNPAAPPNPGNIGSFTGIRNPDEHMGPLLNTETGETIDLRNNPVDPELQALIDQLKKLDIRY